MASGLDDLDAGTVMIIGLGLDDLDAGTVMIIGLGLDDLDTDMVMTIGVSLDDLDTDMVMIIGLGLDDLDTDMVMIIGVSLDDLDTDMVMIIGVSLDDLGSPSRVEAPASHPAGASSARFPTRPSQPVQLEAPGGTASRCCLPQPVTWSRRLDRCGERGQAPDALQARPCDRGLTRERAPAPVQPCLRAVLASAASSPAPSPAPA